MAIVQRLQVEKNMLLWCLSISDDTFNRLLVSTVFLLFLLFISTSVKTIVFFQRDLFNGIAYFVP